jgi:putative ABC transport system permease protein
MILTSNEILMSLEMGLIYGLVAIGIYIAFRIINFSDLTVDGTFVLGSAVSVVIFQMCHSAFLSFFFAFLAGGLAGAFTGFLYAKLKITDLLSGILTGFMLYSVNLRIMKAPNISVDFDFFLHSTLLKISCISIVLGILIIFLLRTDFGLSLRAIGQNKILAHHSGVCVKSTTIIALALSNGIVAFSGALFAGQQGFADIGNGVGTVIIGLASVMIGECIFPCKSLSVKIMSCLIGSIIYRFVITLALNSDSLGIASQDLNLVTGFLIIAILFLKRNNNAKI